jgi:hypothetical protein
MLEIGIKASAFSLPDQDGENAEALRIIRARRSSCI